MALLLWVQFRQRNFTIIIGLKFIIITVFKLNMNTLTGHTIVVGLTRYTNIWKNLFDNRFISLGISGDRVENVFWRARDISFVPSLKNVSPVIPFSVVQVKLIKIPVMISFKV